MRKSERQVLEFLKAAGRPVSFVELWERRVCSHADLEVAVIRLRNAGLIYVDKSPSGLRHLSLV